MEIKPIQKILIANRAEIAARIALSARVKGIQTVGLFTEGEEQFLHTKAVDVAVKLEGEQLSDTYLNQEQIIQIAKEYECDAIHPGYGFLSENAAFAQKVLNEGLIFIGPRPEVIRLMGDKGEARKVALKAGLPLVPGEEVGQQSVDDCLKLAEKIGFPVLIKATAGGGGKGMRRVDKAADFKAAFTQAKSEALASFGNDDLIIEKYLVNPRHIEIQVFGDNCKNYIHFFERDCSVQRRHQKVVEEAPAYALGSDLKRQMYKAAISLCETVDYTNAGTIEFIVDEEGNFYFLEMNTRLQVEHPITEAITDFDLVDLQIDVASGAAFNFEQNDIKKRGHAVELRLYAEDATKGYLPTSGTLENFDFPFVPGFRLDSGYKKGDTISSKFDPMIAKLVFKGIHREQCLAKAAWVLKQAVVTGFVTNIQLLENIMNHEVFKNKAATTSYLTEYNNELNQADIDVDKQLKAIASYLFAKNQKRKSRTTSVKGEVDKRQSTWAINELEGFRNV